MKLISKGVYRAKALEAMWGETGTKKPQVAVLFELLEGDYAGERITYYGVITDKTQDFVLKGLYTAGWTGDEALSGIGSREVDLVIDIEPDLEGKDRNRVKFINEPGSGGLVMKKVLNPTERADVFSRLQGRALEIKKKVDEERAAKGGKG